MVKQKLDTTGQRHTNMSTSSRRLMAKIKKGTPSQTPGKMKGESCQADWRKKYFLSKDNKARKDKQYSTYNLLAHKLNNQVPA